MTENERSCKCIICNKKAEYKHELTHTKAIYHNGKLVNVYCYKCTENSSHRFTENELDWSTTLQRISRNQDNINDYYK